MESAAFFGDVVTQISRAVDDEDEETTETFPPVHWWCPSIRQHIDKSPNKCFKCSILTVAVGPEAVGFCQAYLLPENPEILGVIASEMSGIDSNTFNQNQQADKTCLIHRSATNPQVIVVLCKSFIAPEHAFSWTQQLFDSIDSTNLHVTVLSSSLVTEYRSSVLPSELPTPFLRALTSSMYKSKPQIPFLEAPNIVKGFPAAILNHCQVKKIATILYVAFLDSSCGQDIDSIKVFKPILSSPQIRDHVQPREGASERLKEFLVEGHLNSTNLYT